MPIEVEASAPMTPIACVKKATSWLFNQFSNDSSHQGISAMHGMTPFSRHTCQLRSDRPPLQTILAAQKKKILKNNPRKIFPAGLRKKRLDRFCRASLALQSVVSGLPLPCFLVWATGKSLEAGTRKLQESTSPQRNAGLRPGAFGLNRVRAA